ncbi:MAG TPA: response regulator transcription factor [Acidimicrobiia bacterium]
MTLVLAVDDDPALLRTLAINLSARGYQAATATDGRAALRAVQEQRPDLVVLDLGLPDLDGVAVLRQIRTTNQVPVVVLSARHSSEEKVAALDLGADDYVTKPFGMEELFARLRVALRRGESSERANQPVLQAGALELDRGRRLARRNGQLVHLTPTEWRIVEALTRQPGELITKTDLLQRVWGPEYERETNYLRVYLAHVRRKLEAQPSHPQHFITEPGVGYRFVP